MESGGMRKIVIAVIAFIAPSLAFAVVAGLAQRSADWLNLRRIRQSLPLFAA